VTSGEVIWTETNAGTDCVKLTKVRWGRVVSVRLYPDTAVLKRSRQRIAV
jgi:ketosteroid isomerase-like protein